MRRWAGLPVLGAAALLAIVALALAARRATGALTGPLPPVELLTTAIVVAIWAWGVRTLWRRWSLAPAVRTSPGSYCVRWLSSGGVLLVAVACSWPGGRFVDWLVWVPIVVFDLFGRPIPARRSSPATAKVSLPCDSTPAVEDRVVQQLTRVRMADGSETIHGTLAAHFAPGSRTATLHVAFCPPMARVPHVEAEPAGGVDASVEVSQVLTNGARIDVRLARPAEQDDWATVDFVAADSNDIQ